MAREVGGIVRGIRDLGLGLTYLECRAAGFG